MHPIWKVDDGSILRLIAGDLVRTDKCATALALACTRRSFTTPVLDAMWERGQKDFTALLKTFPPSVWGDFQFRRQPSEEEWDRFSTYASRMRKLFISSSNEFPPKSLSLLKERFSGRHILPNLLELECSDEGKGEFTSVPPFLFSPSLECVKIGLEDIHSTKIIFSALACACRSLRFVYQIEGQSELVEESSTLLLKCTSHELRDFVVEAPISQAAFIHASQLPNLRFFDVKAIQVNQPEPLPATMFPSIRYLLVRGLSADSIWLQSLGRIHSKVLHVIVLELKDVAAARAAVHLIVLRDCLLSGPRQTLTDLSIQCGDDFSGLEVDRTTIEHLLPFTQLTSLSIFFVCGQNQCGYKLSDEDLERLVKAMPNLKSLMLGSQPCSIPANNSINSLVAIADHCKHLEELYMHINVEAIINEGSSVRDRSPGEGPTNEDQALVGCPLRSATFGPCSIPGEVEGERKFTSTLQRLFPRLLYVDGPSRDP